MKYLIPFDFSPTSQNALKQAKFFAEISGGELLLLHIVSDRETFKRKEILLKEYVATMTKSNKYTVNSHVVLGNIFNDIGKIAEYHGADLVVMGTHGLDMLQSIFGSNAVKVIKHSVVPFIMVQEECNIKQLNKIVLPFSIETKSMQVLRFAAHLSKTYNAEIILLGRNHTDEFFKHKENVNILMANKFLKENKVNHRFEIVDVSKTDFEDYIIDYTQKENADLIATTYYSDAVLPMFETFVQNLIFNKFHTPVLCLNAQSLSKIDSTLSFMTI